MSPRVLVACSHGTADPEGTAAVSALVGAARRRSRLPVVEAYVDVHGPYLGDVVDSYAGRVVVLPVLLAAGYHVSVDVARAADGWPDARVGPVLGPDRRITAVLLDRMRSAGVRRDDVVVLAAAGSSDDRAASSVRTAAEQLGAAWGAPVQVAYGAARAPRIADEVARLRAAHPGRRVVAVSYLLATGHFHRLVLAGGADVVTAPLLDGAAPDARLVDVLLDRAAAAARPRPLVEPWLAHR